MQQALRVDAAGVEAMARRWSATAGDLSEVVAPATLGLSYQVSAAAVSAAHVGVTAFIAGLAARVGGHAARVAQTDAQYLAQEAVSSTALAVVSPAATGV